MIFPLVGVTSCPHLKLEALGPAAVPTDNGTNAFALVTSALREAAPSVQAHHELRENVVVPGDRAPTVPRRLCGERYRTVSYASEHVAADGAKAAWRSGRPSLLPRQIGLLPLLRVFLITAVARHKWQSLPPSYVFDSGL